MGKLRILLGGIGDDAHSIGIGVLKLALEDNGYIVTTLGIQNTIDKIIECSTYYDVIFVSCINGHSELYVEANNPMIKQIKNTNNKKIWYIGGNLSVNKTDESVIKEYLMMGFNRVFPKPIDIDEVLNILRQDTKNFKSSIKTDEKLCKSYSELVDQEKVLPADDFFDKNMLETRKEVLKQWETGKDVDFENTINNHNINTSLDDVLWEAEQSGNILLQTRTGVAGLNEQIDLLNSLGKNGLDVASVQLDAASRRTYFQKAHEGVLKSLSLGKSALNGFPVPIHGVNGIAKIVKSLSIPFQVRGGSPDHRFVYEIAIGGGTSGIEGSFLCYLLPYEKCISPLVSLEYWTYIDQLCGMYASKYGVIINREFFGPLTTALVEPSLAIVVNIIEAIHSVKNGVKSISVGLAEYGNRIQDIAALQVLKEMTNHYMKEYGFLDVRVTTVFHQFMGAFPKDLEKAKELIRASATTAKGAKATRILIKTAVEAFNIPTVEDNINALNLVKSGLNDPLYIDQGKLNQEKELIREEVISLMEYIKEAGNGNVVKGAIQAIYDGILDIMFSPSIYNANKLMSFRNIDGAIRFANPENMPFSNKIKDFHREELLQRINIEHDNKIYSIITNDLTRISRCDYKTWPLDGHYIKH